MERGEHMFDIFQMISTVLGKLYDVSDVEKTGISVELAQDDIQGSFERRRCFKDPKGNWVKPIRALVAPELLVAFPCFIMICQ